MLKEVTARPEWAPRVAEEPYGKDRAMAAGCESAEEGGEGTEENVEKVNDSVASTIGYNSISVSRKPRC